MTTHDWPRPWAEIRGGEQTDDETIGYDAAYTALGPDDETLRIYDGTVYVRADAGESDRTDDADAWYPLRAYVERAAVGIEP